MLPLGRTALPLAERPTNEHVLCCPLDARAARRVLWTIAQCLEVDRDVVNRGQFDRTRRFSPDLGVRHRDQSAVAPREDRNVLHVVVCPALTLNGVQDDRLRNPVAGKIAGDDLSRVAVFLTAFSTGLPGDEGIDCRGIVLLRRGGARSAPRKHEHNQDEVEGCALSGLKFHYERLVGASHADAG